MLQIFLTATPFYQRIWFCLLVFVLAIFLLFYGLRWFTRRRYRQIMEARRKADRRIEELLRESRKR